MVSLRQGLALGRKGVISLVGAGGKTSLMFRLAHELAASGETVLTTTTTKILRPTAEQSKHIVISDSPVDILKKAKEPVDVNLTLSIWDILGQKDESAMRTRPLYFNGTNGAFIICDVTRKETFKNLTEWIYSLMNVTHKVPIVILGNKIDRYQDAEVLYRDLEKFASDHNIPMFATSAKNNSNVEKAFAKLSELMLEESISEN